MRKLGVLSKVWKCISERQPERKRTRATAEPHGDEKFDTFRETRDLLELFADSSSSTEALIVPKNSGNVIALHCSVYNHVTYVSLITSRFMDLWSERDGRWVKLKSAKASDIPDTVRSSLFLLNEERLCLVSYEARRVHKNESSLLNEAVVFLLDNDATDAVERFSSIILSEVVAMQKVCFAKVDSCKTVVFYTLGPGRLLYNTKMIYGVL